MSEVTDVMVEAACTAMCAYTKALFVARFTGGSFGRDAWEDHFESVRAGITAALKVGCTHPRMGDWWPCNYGADEVRMCPDCDYLEKRVVGVASAPTVSALTVLRSHQWDQLAQGCTCGWSQKRSMPRDSRRMNHPTHVADVLKREGVLS